MFDFIKAHSDHYKGPAQGIGSEYGDSWPTAVEKINAGFKNVLAWIEGFDPDAKAKVTEAPMGEAEIGYLIARAVQPLQDQVTSLTQEIEAYRAEIAIMRNFFEPQPEAQPAPADDPKLPPPEPPAAPEVQVGQAPQS